MLSFVRTVSPILWMPFDIHSQLPLSPQGRQNSSPTAGGQASCLILELPAWPWAQHRVNQGDFFMFSSSSILCFAFFPDPAVSSPTAEPDIFVSYTLLTTMPRNTRGGYMWRLCMRCFVPSKPPRIISESSGYGLHTLIKMNIEGLSVDPFAPLRSGAVSFRQYHFRITPVYLITHIDTKPFNAAQMSCNAHGVFPFELSR